MDKREFFEMPYNWREGFFCFEYGAKLSELTQELSPLEAAKFEAGFDYAYELYMRHASMRNE